MKLTFRDTALLAVVALIVFIVLYALVVRPIPVSAGAGELPGTVATTSVANVSITPSTVFATSTCGGRVISTTASAIMITFSDNQGAVPSGTFGTLQAASTTVAYSNSIYGCGAYKVYSFASGPITVVESR